MSLHASLRPLLGLVVGLVVGGFGAGLFMQSMPPKEGSPEERVATMEVELKSARNRIAALEASDPHGSRRPGGTFRDRARGIAEDLRDGKPVTPDDIFRATQPLLRDLTPLLDRIRARDQQRRIDSICGELTRKYDLTEAQQATLRQWFEGKAKEEEKRFNDLVASDGTTLEAMILASRDVRPDDGLEKAMEGVLSGDKLAAFKADRMTERAERVQQEADMRLSRLDGIVGLDDSQRNQVFSIMARTSRDFDPAMQFEGVSEQATTSLPAAGRQDAILAVLRPDQRQAYEAERQKRRETAERDMQAIGLTLPPAWDLLDDNDLR